MHKQLTISQIEEQIATQPLSRTELEQLKKDRRIGVQKLIVKYDREQIKARQQKQLFEEMMSYERGHYQQGKTLIAGMDEAGRGPLAGPVVAAAVILKEDFYLPGLNDSKQLNAKTREDYYSVITKQAIAYGVGMIHNEEIDRINIYQATKQAMKKAIQSLDPIPDHVLIDAVPLDGLPCTSEAIIKGDQKSVSVAAASIVAKVTRDRLMYKLHEQYPVYNFASNMGYGTKEHLEAIEQHGSCPYHRESFAPIRMVKDR